MSGTNFALGITLTGNVAPSLKSAINFSKLSINSLGKSFENTNKGMTLKPLKNYFQEGKSSLQMLGHFFKNLQHDISNTDQEAKKLGTSLTNIKKPNFKSGNFLESSKNELLKIGAVGLSLKGLTTSYAEVQRAQGELATLGIDENGINIITKKGEEFSTKFAGVTAANFVRASYDIKSGISALGNSAIAEYTKIAALTAIGTKGNVEQMTSLFATGFGIYRKQFESEGQNLIKDWSKLSSEEKDIEFGKHFSNGLSLAVRVFKTDGAKITAAMEGLGKAATLSGVPFEEQLTVLGQLQQTMPAPEAATKYRSFLKSVFEAGKKLELKFDDPKTGKLKSVVTILDMINKKYHGIMSMKNKNEIAKAFSDEEAGLFVTTLLDNLQLLKSGYKELKQEMISNKDITLNMAKSAQRGRDFEHIGQKFENLSISIGRALEPLTNIFTSIIGKTLDTLKNWTDKFHAVTAGIVGGVTIFLSLGAVIKSTRFLLKLLGIETLGFNFIFASLGTTILSAIGKIWSILKVMGPINILGAVIALAEASYLIYKNWEPIKTFFSDLWATVKFQTNDFFNWFGSKINSIGESFKKIKEYFTADPSERTFAVINERKIERETISPIQNNRKENPLTVHVAFNGPMNMQTTDGKILDKSDFLLELESKIVSTMNKVRERSINRSFSDYIA